MKYQKIIRLFDNTPNEPTKFRTKSWVEINDGARGTYNTIVNLNLNLQCWSQVYAIIVMHIYLLKEL